jgi:MFS family permease
MKRIGWKDHFGMNLYWLGLGFMWNSLHPIILPTILLNFVPEDLKNTYLGLLTFVGLLLAMIIQPISGTASDGWRSKLGRRRPLAILGTSLDFFFLALLAWSGNIYVVIIGYIGLQIVSNIAHGPMQGLIPDIVPPDQLGAASGVKNLMDMLGLIAASLAAGKLMPSDASNPTLVLLVIMAVLALTATGTFLQVKEMSSLEDEKHDFKPLGWDQFRSILKINPNFLGFILSRFLFLVGVYGVQTFAQYFIRDVLQVQNAVQATGDLMAVLAISLVICALLAGWVSDRWGPNKVLIAASILAGIGSGLLIFAKDLTQVKVFGSVLGAGIGLFLTANWTLASQLAPKKEAGKYMGLTNFATAGASAASKLFGIPIDWLNRNSPGEFRGYDLLFAGGALFAMISLFYLVVQRKRTYK